MWIGLSSGVLADPEVDPKELPRIKPTSADEALGTFKIVPGYKLELVAAEPLVVDPIAIAFDEKRRMFVVEMRGYSERRDERLGRIRLLTDEDGDGEFDRSTIYAEDLCWPTAVIAWDGGIFVAATPDIFYFKDVDGDGVSDSKATIFTGFGAGATRLNVQALVNSFKWGPDGRIHGATAGNGGRVHRFGQDSDTITELRGLDFSFDPQTLDFRAENGGGQYGLCFDHSGNKFVCSNSNHIQLIRYPRRYAGAPMKPARGGISKDGPAAEVFRLSQDEPWRVVRTRWRIDGKVKGPVEGGGRVSGYFTAATGIGIHRGDAFICDAGSNLVHRKQLLSNMASPGFFAERPAAEKQVEFLASNDNWFRPVQMVSGPDGALYIVDMYREVIEHPWSLPPSIKKHLDLNSGNDRGRIYRIVPDGFVQPPPLDLAALSTTELIRHLSSQRYDWRLVAKVLRARQDLEMIPLLQKYFGTSGDPEALQLLHDCGALDPGILLDALSDGSPETRRRALVLSESLELLPEVAKEKFAELASDRFPDVRYQLALTLGLRDGSWRFPILAKLFEGTPDDQIARAALKALGGSAGVVFEAVANTKTQAPIELLVSIAVIIGSTGTPDEIAIVQKFADRSPGRKFQILAALGFTGSPELVSAAFKIARDANQVLAERVGAIEFAGNTKVYDAEFAELFADATEPGILEAIAGCHAYDDGSPLWAIRFVDRWNDFSPRGKVRALAAMTGSERVPILLEAIEAKKIPASAVDGATVDRLRNHDDAEIRELADKVFPATTDGRLEVLEKYSPALELKGDAGTGREIYSARCMICHRSGELGFAYGPDVASFRASGKQSILSNLIDPAREIQPQFAIQEITLKNGARMVGRITDQGEDQIQLLLPAGVEQSIGRETVVKIQVLPNSPMPEGLESGLSVQQMADLLEFLTRPE